MSTCRRFALVLAWFAACSGSDPRSVPPTPPRDAAVTRPPVAKDSAPDLGFIGVLFASESVDIAPQFPGVLAAVHVRPGDIVAAGAVIAELDPRPVQEELRAAEAALSAAEASGRQARVDLKDSRRRLELEKASVKAGVSPGASLEEAELAVERARATVQREASTADDQRSRLRSAKDHLAKTKLTAPFAGTVAVRVRDAGATVAAGQRIVSIVGLRGVRLRFAVPPERVGAFTSGVAVIATIDTVAAPQPATIDQVSPVADAASGLFFIEAALPADAPTASLRHGLAARIRATPP